MLGSRYTTCDGSTSGTLLTAQVLELSSTRTGALAERTVANAVVALASIAIGPGCPGRVGQECEPGSLRRRHNTSCRKDDLPLRCDNGQVSFPEPARSTGRLREWQMAFFEGGASLPYAVTFMASGIAG